MERIDREYAIIYVDKTGESLTSRGQATKELVGDYYKQQGFLQWNFYLIIVEESIEDACYKYTRKYVMPEASIDKFIEINFPVLQEKRGKVEMIEAEGYREAKKLAFKKKSDYDLSFPSHDVMLIPSINREFNLDITLRYLDDVRNVLILNPNLHIIFYSHIRNENSLAKKKFKLFLIKEES